MYFVLGLALLPGNELVQIVAERPVSAKTLFVKQPLNAAAQAHLIGMLLEANRPTHFAMPATAQDQHRGSGNASCKQTQGNLPTRLLFLSHPTRPPNRRATHRPVDHSSS